MDRREERFFYFWSGFFGHFTFVALNNLILEIYSEKSNYLIFGVGGGII